ncbi:hypothetical protein [Fusobacterium sp. MFO224]|uniref:hypothetical protein n=1 Tax=Fusobacterium sp. MFO224 TaxID=3378070 RepID=UPI0038530EEE
MNSFKENIEKIIKILDYNFYFVQKLEPERNSENKIIKVKFKLKEGKRINNYGDKEFCKFGIEKEKYYKVAGVYSIIIEGEIKYIGQASDFYKRFKDYGKISERNCYSDGQSTNCKINNLILENYLSGKEIYLYFYPTAYYDKVEKELIRLINPLYNTQLLNNLKNKKVKNINEKYLVDIAQEEIEKIIYSERKLKKTEITILSKDIHERLGWDKRYPTVCSAMRKLKDKYKNEEIYSPPKGNGSSLEIKYIIE